jgi:hypothetical protein
VFDGSDGRRSAYTPCNRGPKNGIPGHNRFDANTVLAYNSAVRTGCATPNFLPRARPFLGKVLEDKQTPVLDMRPGPWQLRTAAQVTHQ